MAPRRVYGSASAAPFAVVWAAEVAAPLAGLVQPLPAVLHASWPDLFPTTSAAKKVCRRRELYVDGVLG
jgi:phage tail protein X